MISYVIRPVEKRDLPDIENILKEHWGSVNSVSRGIIYDASKLHGFVADRNAEIVGLATYNIDDRGCEIVTLNSLREGIGIGTGLIEKVKIKAVDKGCHRLWLITTNDNNQAQEFYIKRGFRIAAVHKDAIAESRKLKPEIPLYGFGGIAITDEIEMEILL